MNIHKPWHLKEFIGSILPNACSAVALMGVPGPAQKLILQIWDEHGVIAYLKYGETPAARTRVAREHEVLQRIPSGFGPAAVKYGAVGDGDGLLISPVLGRMLPATLPPPHIVIEFFRNLTATPPLALEHHPWARERLDRYGQQIEPWLEVLNHREWSVVYQHGDPAPWNFLQTSSGLMAIDWEYGSPQGFPYLDLAQYHLQVGTLIYRWRPKTAQENAIKYLCECLPSLSRSQARALVCLAAFQAYCEALADGHSAATPLQSWRRALWEHRESTD